MQFYIVIILKLVKYIQASLPEEIGPIVQKEVLKNGIKELRNRYGLFTFKG